MIATRETIDGRRVVVRCFVTDGGRSGDFKRQKGDDECAITRGRNRRIGLDVPVVRLARDLVEQ
jgi:hypothetical protein